jgi:hypothetical protein
MSNTKIPDVGSRWLRNEVGVRGQGLHVVVVKIETGQIDGVEVVRVRYRHERTNRTGSTPLYDFLNRSQFLPADPDAPRSTEELARALLPVLQGLTVEQLGRVEQACAAAGEEIRILDAAAIAAPLPPVPSAREAREAFLAMLHGRGTPTDRESVLWYFFNAIEREERPIVTNG